MITLEELKKAMPVALRTSATENLVDILNNIPTDPEVADNIRNNFLSYTGILQDGRFKIEDYLNAIAYCSFKLMGHNNQEAYARTFPQRYQRLTAKGTSSKDVAAYVHAYNKNKLVNLIMEQSMIPTWVLNQDMHQQALNRQFHLMNNAKSEMVQMQAANSILLHLKKPETKEFNINLGSTQDAGVQELTKMMGELAEQQQEMIRSGVSTKTIAHTKLVLDAEVIDDAS